MSMTLTINKKPFTLWETASLRRSIDENCGSYKFTTSSGIPKTDYPVKVGDLAEVFVNGYRRAVGFIDTIRVNEIAGRHTISCEGRDAIQDLIDSSVPDSAKVTEGPVTMTTLCQLVVDSLGAPIRVVDWVTNKGVTEIEPFSADELEASESGQKCMQYLVSFARKRQLYLISEVDKNGSYLIIYRPFTADKASSPLIHKANNSSNNILSYSLKMSNADRFNSYVCKSQGNLSMPVPLAVKDNPVEAIDTSSEIIDPAIRDSRYLEIQAEESMDTNDCLVRATEECNLRRVNGQLYSCTVAGHTQANGNPWDFGQFVQVHDDFAGVSGEHLIKEVEFTVDIKKGEQTKITCCPPDGYTTDAIATALVTRKSITGWLNDRVGGIYQLTPLPIPLIDIMKRWEEPQIPITINHDPTEFINH